MKKFLMFISFLVLLIIAEYYFLMEVFSERRVPYILVTLLLIFICIFAFIRFFKKFVYPKGKL